MRFNTAVCMKIGRSYPVRIGIAAVVWFALITAMHYTLNGEHDDRQVVQMGYMPVITNLAAPLLDYASAHGDSQVRYRAIKFASFAEMAEALRNNEIQAAFIIAPLSIVLRQQGENVKVVYIGNRHESTLVVRKELKIKRFTDLIGHTVAVPMRYSGHNLGMLRMMREQGLDDKIRVVEMNPPDMASALAAGSLDAYFVGEPFAAQTLKAGVADLLFYVEDVWPGFICNLILVKDEFIRKNTDAVRWLIEGAARSGIWAQKHCDEAAKIASSYWGQTVPLVKYALSMPDHRIVFDRFVPVEEELQEMAQLMVQFGLLENADIDGLVDDRFARQADLTGISDLQSILKKP